MVLHVFKYWSSEVDFTFARGQQGVDIESTIQQYNFLKEKLRT